MHIAFLAAIGANFEQDNKAAHLSLYFDYFMVKMFYDE